MIAPTVGAVIALAIGSGSATLVFLAIVFLIHFFSTGYVCVSSVLSTSCCHGKKVSRPMLRKCSKRGRPSTPRERTNLKALLSNFISTTKRCFQGFSTTSKQNKGYINISDLGGIENLEFISDNELARQISAEKRDRKRKEYMEYLRFLDPDLWLELRKRFSEHTYLAEVGRIMKVIEKNEKKKINAKMKNRVIEKNE